MLSAAFDTSYSDKLFYNLQDYDSDYEYLSEALPQASSDEEKAEILWRLSRTKLTLTDEISKDEKDAM